MKIDVRALGTFNRLAHEGAEQAAASLGELTTVEPTVETTAINLVAREDAGEAFADSEFVGVQIGFGGGMAGESVLAIDRDGARRLLGNLPAGAATGLTEGRVREVGNILIGGFLDGWADYLGTAIDITTPVYVEGSGSDVIPEEAPGWEDHEQVLAFTSELEASDEAVELMIYLLPDLRDFERHVGGPRAGGGVPIPFEELSVFNHMTKAGAASASEKVTAMTGMETTVEVSNLSFVPVDSISSWAGQETLVGVTIEFHGLPSGYVVVFFDESSAGLLAEEVAPEPVLGDGFGEMHRSAIEEIANVMTSGFVDGWANVLGTTIDITPPKFVHDDGQSIMDPIATRIGRTQEFAFVIDSALVTTNQQIECNVCALPNERELARALNALPLDPNDVDGSDPTPVPGMDARYEDL